MAITVADTYATNSSNLAASSPNLVSVINDGTGVEQVVAIGDGTGTTAGITSSKLNVNSYITDGTNIVNVLKSDGTAAGQNAQLVAPAYKEVGSLTAGVLNADRIKLNIKHRNSYKGIGYKYTVNSLWMVLL